MSSHETVKRKIAFSWDNSVMRSTGHDVCIHPGMISILWIIGGAWILVAMMFTMALALAAKNRLHGHETFAPQKKFTPSKSGVADMESLPSHFACQQ